MNSNRFVKTTAGFTLLLVIFLTVVWLMQPARPPAPKELSLDKVTDVIDKKEIKEITIKQWQVELIDKNDNRFFANAGSDETREVLLKKISEFNAANTSSPIKLNEEPVSSGWGWILMLHLPNLIFLLMWALTLAVIVYVVRTLSRNKS